MRLLVCGGRDYYDYETLYETLHAIHKKIGITCIIQGEQRGADLMAKDWAEQMGIATDDYKAEWIKLGGKAGPIRNKRMLDEGRPDCFYAFPGGKGTANMTKQAKKRKIVQITLDDPVSLQEFFE